MGVPVDSRSRRADVTRMIRRPSVRTVTGIIIAAVVLTACALAVVTYSAVQHRRDASEAVARAAAKNRLLQDAHSGALEEVAAAAGYYALHRPEYRDNFQKAADKVDLALTALHRDAVEHQPELAATVQRLQATHDGIVLLYGRALELVGQNDIAGVIEVVVEGGLEGTVTRWFEDVAALEDGAHAELLAAQHNDQAAQTVSDRLSVAIVGAWALLIILGGLLILRWVVRPIERVRATTRAIAAGDLRARVTQAGPAELVDLAVDINDMADTLVTLNESLEDRVAERTKEAAERAQQLATRNEELQESEARKGAILEGALDCIITIDHEGRVIEFNSAAERTFNYPRARAVGQQLAELIIPPPLRERHYQGLARYLAAGEGPVIGKLVELTAMRSDGSEFPVELAITRVPTPGPPTFTGIIRDISERKRAEQRLSDSLAELERRNEELDAFAYSVSHDLKEPLRTLEAFSQFLLDDYSDALDEQGRDYLQKLAKASVRMKQLIDDLLVLSRVSRPAGALEEVNAGQVAKEIVESMRFAIEERGASVTVQDGLPNVIAERSRLEQIFGNLLTNALKFNESDRPLITIGAQAVEDGVATLYVQDDGLGIDPAYHERIFGVFQRLHRREAYEGTGAGLAIVKKAVEACGGRVWVDSKLGSGATFLFTLPLASESPSQSVPEAA